MKIQLISLGTRLPDWVNAGFRTYQQRLRYPWQLDLVELPLPKRTAGQSIHQLKTQEAQLIKQQLIKNNKIICLDVLGKTLSTPQLAKNLQQFYDQGEKLSIIIGGPDGLDPSILEKAQQTWSLSHLTLPHGLVRVVIAEAIYRSWSVAHGHPYHRE